MTDIGDSFNKKLFKKIQNNYYFNKVTLPSDASLRKEVQVQLLSLV